MSMRTKRGSAAVALMLAVFLLAMPTFAGANVYATATTATIMNGPVTVYATAHLGSPVITQLGSGTRVQVTSFNDNWAEIILGGGVVGYVVTSYLNFGAMPPVIIPPAPTAEPVHHEKVNTAGANATVATANKGPLHLRANPSFDAAVTETYANGSRVQVLSQKGGWYHVQAGSSTGYMDVEFVKLDDGVTPYGSNGFDAVVNNPTSGQVLHLRAKPSVESESLGQYHNGTYVEVLDIGTQWMRVVVEDKEGYMDAEYVRITTPDVTADKLITGGEDGYVDLYDGPATSMNVLSRIGNGSTVTVLIPGAEWSKVEVSLDGSMEMGYVQNGYLESMVQSLG